jgi:signal transduction histidine kinase
MVKERIKVLIVEDDPGDARLAEVTLSQSSHLVFETEITDCLSLAMERLCGGSFDVVLLDMGLPDSQGLDTLSRVHNENQEIPIVVLTGFDDEEMGVQAMQAGAQDYLAKGQDVNRSLIRCIRYAIERKKAETQIKTYTQELAERNKQLNLQTQKALEASRLKSEFLANMSHEIRTPLNAIMGFAQLLKDDSENPLTDSQREFLGYVLSGGENLLNIINDILDLSRVEAEKITLENIECSLKDIIDELHKMFKQRADEKGIDLRISYEEDISDKLLSDPTRLRQILLNLTGNAIKFTDKGYVEIGVQKGNNFPERLEFYVRDTGIGIPQEKIESIFNPFEQVDGSMTRKYGGTGLGLAIVNRLVGLMGGEIKVISQLGKGSTFYFQILYEAVGDIVEPPEIKGKEGGKGRVILVAEDNDLNYRLIETLLTKKDFDVVRARNGEDAISIYKTKRDEIRLILMDVQMPVLGGLEATKVIRKYNGNVPIIAITAHAMKGDQEKFLEAGCTDYISKPFRPRELLGKIKALRVG